jgi:quinol monooxygenase YgiN
MVALIAKMKIKEGKMDEATELFRELVPKVAEEEGTVGYAVCRDNKNPDLLVVVERYRDREAIQAHSFTPHFKEFSKALGAVLMEKPDINILEEIISI